MVIPCYPDFTPLTFELAQEVRNLLSQLTDGVSEFTFANLYLFRKRYNYQLSLNPGTDNLILSGELNGNKFFLTPKALPAEEILINLLHTHDYWKNIPDSIVNEHKDTLERLGIEITEDRDQFDYLYMRTDLAELPGKKYHKKRNLVNAFLNSYSYEVRPLTEELLPHAFLILDRWRDEKNDAGDYQATREGLELFSALGMQGAVYYADGKPAGFCSGEIMLRNTMFAVHFEKGLEMYKGIYQFINQNFAASLPEHILYINREQDLGDEGLRQAKMTYRPCGFVKKHKGELIRQAV